MAVIAVAVSQQGCVSTPPRQAEIRVRLLPDGKFQTPANTVVTLAALPNALKKQGGYAETVVIIMAPPSTPEAKRVQIVRVLKAKGFLRVMFGHRPKTKVEVVRPDR